jgi:hypothetical protein
VKGGEVTGVDERMVAAKKDCQMELDGMNSDLIGRKQKSDVRDNFLMFPPFFSFCGLFYLSLSNKYAYTRPAYTRPLTLRSGDSMKLRMPENSLHQIHLIYLCELPQRRVRYDVTSLRNKTKLN